MDFSVYLWHRRRAAAMTWEKIDWYSCCLSRHRNRASEFLAALLTILFLPQLQGKNWGDGIHPQKTARWFEMETSWCLKKKKKIMSKWHILTEFVISRGVCTGKIKDRYTLLLPPKKQSRSKDKVEVFLLHYLYAAGDANCDCGTSVTVAVWSAGIP